MIPFAHFYGSVYKNLVIRQKTLMTQKVIGPLVLKVHLI